MLVSVSAEAFAPDKLVPLNRHCNTGIGAPVTVTLTVRFDPATTT